MLIRRDKQFLNMIIGPYKETQAFISGELLRDTQYIFFLNFVSWEESNVVQYRDYVEEKDCILQFSYNDLFRFEPLKGAKMQYNLAQSSAFIYFKKDELPESKVIVFLEELIKNSYFLLNFIKYKNFLLTKQQLEAIVLFDKSFFFGSIGNFYSLLLNKFIYIYKYYYSFFQFFFLVKFKKDANLSTVSSKKEKPQS